MIFSSVGSYEKAMGMMETAMTLVPKVPASYLGTLGRIDRAMGRPEKAIESQKEALVRDPLFFDAYLSHLELTILYSELHRVEDARKEAREVLTLVPHFTVDVWGQRNPMKDQGQIERDMVALRKAGFK